MGDLNIDSMLQTATACRPDDTWCQWVGNATGNQWLAASASWLIAKPLSILFILVLALIVRALVRGSIDRLTAGGREGKLPTLLRPLRERSDAKKLAGPLLSERRAQRAKTIGSVLKSFTSFVVYGLAFIMVLRDLGIDVAPILASAGVVGVAIGFGAQNLVKDFLSGMFMMLEDQYGVGDVIDVGPASGTVESVGLRVTTLRDTGGTVWYVRNGAISRVGNSSQGYAVAVVDLPLAYTANLSHASEIVQQVAAEAAEAEPMSGDVIGKPEVLGVEKITAETITLRMTVRVRPGRQWATQRALRAQIMTALDEAGLEPPLGRNGTVADRELTG